MINKPKQKLVSRISAKTAIESVKSVRLVCREVEVVVLLIPGKFESRDPNFTRPRVASSAIVWPSTVHTARPSFARSTHSLTHSLTNWVCGLESGEWTPVQAQVNGSVCLDRRTTGGRGWVQATMACTALMAYQCSWVNVTRPRQTIGCMVSGL